MHFFKHTRPIHHPSHSALSPMFYNGAFVRADDDHAFATDLAFFMSFALCDA